MASANILKYLKRKKSGAYDAPVYIGAEQRFVGAVRGTSNNNLEEQSILGLDCITTSYWDKTVFIEKKEFHNGTKTNEFYILESKIYNAAPDAGFVEGSVQFSTDSIYFENEYIVANADANASFIGDVFTISQNNVSTIATIDEIDEDFKRIREDILFYKNKQNTVIEISTRTIYEKEVNGKTITKTLIENKL